MTKHCEVCGREFRTYPSHVKAGRGRFCSRTCKGRNEQSPSKIGEHDGHTLYINHVGYVMIVLGRSQEKLYHVFLMEQYLGQSLKGKQVHHRDGNRLNNSLENLMVMQNDAEHRQEHYRMNLEARGGKVGVHKWCPCCTTLKLLEDFPKSKNNWDGRYGMCKPCAVKSTRKHRLNRRQRETVS